MANNDDNILRVEKDGVEYYTLLKTGTSGMSHRGLSRARDKAPSTINHLVTKVFEGKATKRLNRFAGKDLRLFDGGKGGRVIYNADLCAAVIQHYAFLGSETAQDTLDAIGEIGLTSYIQGITGWLPEMYQASPESRRLLSLLITDQPKKAELHFDENWQKAACRVTGYAWEGLPMARFIRKAVYDWFPQKLVERLVEVNPYIETRPNRRQNCHYQHFSEQVDETLLKTHIRDVYTLMCIAQSQQQFWQLMKDRFGVGIQLEFLED